MYVGMVPGWEDLLCKHEDLGVNLKHACENLGVAEVCLEPPALGGRGR